MRSGVASTPFSSTKEKGSPRRSPSNVSRVEARKVAVGGQVHDGIEALDAPLVPQQSRDAPDAALAHVATAVLERCQDDELQHPVERVPLELQPTVHVEHHVVEPGPMQQLGVPSAARATREVHAGKPCTHATRKRHAHPAGGTAHHNALTGLYVQVSEGLEGGVVGLGMAANTSHGRPDVTG